MTCNVAPCTVGFKLCNRQLPGPYPHQTPGGGGGGGWAVLFYKIFVTIFCNNNNNKKRISGAPLIPPPPPGGYGPDYMFWLVFKMLSFSSVKTITSFMLGCHELYTFCHFFNISFSALIMIHRFETFCVSGLLELLLRSVIFVMMFICDVRRRGCAV